MASEFLGTYKVGLVLSAEPATGNKNLTACSIDIGDADAPITVVTAASNVKEGSRYEHMFPAERLLCLLSVSSCFSTDA